MSSLFVSYSRQDSPFANALLDELEDRGFSVWMDYQSLTPAKPWAEQIDQGIQEADVVLLVVSKASLASQYAGDEIARAFEFKKRVILIIFQAVQLPPWLEQCEWVDFRRSFKRGLGELLKQLESPRINLPLAPRQGFVAPPLVWISVLIAIAVCFVSLISFWTLYVPYFLIPLPYRILKRDFNFFHVRLALILLPFANLLSIALGHNNQSDSLSWFQLYWFLSFFLSLVLVPTLILLLRSSVMRRWGKPIASVPTFANLYRPNIEKPRSVTFSVDVAPEDRRYASDLISALEKYGHRLQEEQEAEVAFVLVSRYKTLTHLDPETRVVYPVILQSIKRIDPKLERIQWIDFRRGLKNLNALAQLLPEPTKIFKALGISPAGNQTVLPPIINAIVVYLIILGIFTTGGCALSLFQLSGLIKFTDILIPVGATVLLLMASFFTARSLINRKGRLCYLRYLIPVLTVGFGFSIFYVINRVLDLRRSMPQVEGDIRGFTITVGLWVYVVGSLLIGILAMWHWKDLRRWTPQKNRNKLVLSRGELVSGPP